MISDNIKKYRKEKGISQEELDNRRRKENLIVQANSKHNLILFLSFTSMLVVLIVRNEMLSIVLVGVCILAAVWVLYKNLALLTSVTICNGVNIMCNTFCRYCITKTAIQQTYRT